MLTKRIIPCLDIKDGRTVKGINFKNLRDAGDPVELGALYAEQGADELVFLDITATNENRDTLYALVKDIARHINIPFTVGGGVRSISDVGSLLNSGADKVTVNSSAVNNPSLLEGISSEFGNQCLVLAVDAHFNGTQWRVYTHGGSRPTELDLYEWSRNAVESGAGEIMFTSMNHDGTKQGFAVEALRTLADTVTIPVIASGGAGSMDHFLVVFTNGKADAALAASIFHYKEIGIRELKNYLLSNGLPIRN